MITRAIFLSTWLIATVCYAEPAAHPFQPGETIRYKIKQMAATVGRASLTYEGPQKLSDGTEALLIVFKATGFNFLDEEKIYLDQETFLPVVVHRNLNIFGKKEKIIEEYFPNEGKIKITKTVGKNTTEQIIEKEGPIENLYGFIYRYRSRGTFAKGEKLPVHLPTKDVIIILEDEVKLKAAGEVYKASYMKSDDQKYQIWVDQGANRIPLRISGSVGLANTMMVMTEYTSGKGTEQ